jgi:sortase A
VTTVDDDLAGPAESGPPAAGAPAVEPGRPPAPPRFTLPTRAELRAAIEKLVARVRESNANRGELNATASSIQWSLVMLGGLAVWLLIFALGLSAVEEHHQQHGLYATFRQSVADGVAPIGGAIKRGTPVAMFQSSRGGMHDLVAVEGTSSGELRSGPGHYPGTMLPGQAGVALFFGRSTSFGGPFGDVTRLRKGDLIAATTGQGKFSYKVTAVLHAGDPQPALAAGASELRLVTSEGSGWRSGWAPTRAVFVDALLVGQPVGAPTAVSAAHASDRLMHGDSGGLTSLLLWMQLLVLAVVGAVIARHKWGFWQTWVVGAPVLVAALWGASQSFWSLLPNVL